MGQAELQASRGSLHILDDKVKQVDQVRDHFLTILHKDMNPKIELARADLKKKQSDLQHEKDAVDNLKVQENKEMVNTNQMAQDLKSTRRQLGDLRAQEALAKK